MMVDNPLGSQDVYERVREMIGLERPAGDTFHLAAPKPEPSAPRRVPTAVLAGSQPRVLLKEEEMPNASRETASERVTTDGLEVRLEHLDGGYSVCFESHTGDADLAGLFRGLPDDRAQLPRWGYVIEGKVGFRFADREETYEAGDAYYVPPGHTPVHYAGAEIVEFSPTDALGQTIPVVVENLEAAGAEVEATR